MSLLLCLSVISSCMEHKKKVFTELNTAHASVQHQTLSFSVQVCIFAKNSKTLWSTAVLPVHFSIRRFFFFNKQISTDSDKKSFFMQIVPQERKKNQFRTSATLAMNLKYHFELKHLACLGKYLQVIDDNKKLLPG